MERGRPPQVSWIVASEAYTEHPNWEPDFGAWYVSQVVDILASNPEVWSKMALFLTYDEEGGFFDHIVPPTPPQTRAQGLSTVPITNEIFPGDADGHQPPAPPHRPAPAPAGARRAPGPAAALHPARHRPRRRPISVHQVPQHRCGFGGVPRAAGPQQRGAAQLHGRAGHDDAFEHRYAGHVENGRASITDPAMGGII